ncbi:uncharacterized protein M6B38_340060 [Iris pallida]|uniref:Uncharacterized protein n=1 Tax=Iris pallida TaxID=29817 RepID=A0AAX6GYZ4_IRIPA|nr:uncharacterized protein M6B38_340060 [Iris pallida]
MVCGATAQRRDSAALGATITPADSTDHALPRSSPSVGVRRRVRCFVATAPFDEQSPPLSHATAPSTSMVASRRSALLRDNRGASADPRRCRLPASVSHLLSPDGTSAARALVGWRHRSPRQPRPPVLPLTRRQSQRQDRASAPMPASRLDLRPPRCWQAPTGHERTRTSRRRLPLEQRPCQPILSSSATPRRRRWAESPAVLSTTRSLHLSAFLVRCRRAEASARPSVEPRLQYWSPPRLSGLFQTQRDCRFHQQGPCSAPLREGTR